MDNTLSTDDTDDRKDNCSARLIDGLLLVIGVGTISWWLADYVPELGSVTIAILLGIVVGNLLPNTAPYRPGMQFAEKRLLPIAIALLGVELQLATLVDLGASAVVIIGVSIATSMALSLWLGHRLGYSRNFSLLIGAGNGICGSSAVAATGIAIDAEENDTGMAISIVNLLGTLGIFLIPALINLIRLDENQSGLLIGGTLQAVGQVVAAGFSVDDTVGGIATVVKMGRVLMLGPVVILIFSVIQRQRVSARAQARPGIKIPGFIIWFAILSLVASMGVLPEGVINIVKTGGKYLLVLAMAGIGMRIHLLTLYQSGPRALVFGGVVWLVQIFVTIGFVAMIIS